MQEKRKYPRFDTVAKISVKKTGGDNVATDTFVKNISAEGFCFSSSEQFAQGDIIEITITEKETEVSPMRIRGEVIWSNDVSDSTNGPQKESFLTGVRVSGIRKSDEARFAMLYCERMLAELKSFLRM